MTTEMTTFLETLSFFLFSCKSKTILKKKKTTKSMKMLFGLEFDEIIETIHINDKLYVVN